MDNRCCPTTSETRSGFWEQFPVKRLFDLTVTMIALPFIVPIVGVVALVAGFVHGGPLLFTQMRPGLHGRPFRLYKFRTMTNDRGPDGQLLPDENRLTRFGKLMRSSRLDELPELINVLK